MEHGRDRRQSVVDEIRIYVEGGGDSKSARSSIRAGFGQFLDSLRQLARERRIQWNVIACGPRNAAFANFETALRTHTEAFNVLLVDAEDAVSQTPWKHLEDRAGWEKPAPAADQHCHLMVRTVEAWLVADPEALESFYGQGFRRNVLPTRKDVESVEKPQLNEALKRATEGTTKGSYHKIGHCSELLGRIDPAKVRARAKHCDRLFTTLTGELTS